MRFDTSIPSPGGEPFGEDRSQRNMPGRMTDKWKLVSMGLVILSLLLILPLAYFWRKSSDEAAALLDLQTTMQNTQNQLLDGLDAQASLSDQLKTSEDKVASLTHDLVQTQIELTLRKLSATVQVLPSDQEENVFFFVDSATANPTIYRYSLADDKQYADTGTIDLAGTRIVLYREFDAAPVNLLFLDSRRLVFTQDTETQKSVACYNPLLSSHLYYVDSAAENGSKNTYKPSSDKLQQARVDQKACQAPSGL